MQLELLLKNIPVLSISGRGEADVTGLAYDSRRVGPGMLFAALRGGSVDGHEFILPAVERGACAVMCETTGLVPNRAVQIQVSNTRRVLPVLAANFFGHPATKLRTAGVTGTNGKTTVTFLLKHLWEAAGSSCGLIGTVRYEIGDRIIPAQRTTPEALDLQYLMSQMVRSQCRACVMEVSSHALEQQRVTGIDFEVAIFTNLTPDHLDFHGSMEAYYLAKRALFAGQDGRRPRPVINIDDPYGRRLLSDLGASNAVTYGLDGTGMFGAEALEFDARQTRFVLRTPAGSGMAVIPLIGRHNVYNTLAALAAFYALEPERPLAPSVLAGLPSVPGRLERVDRGQPFAVFVDYAHTEDALRNVLRALREVSSGRLLVLFGCGGNRDRSKREQMGMAAAELADVTLITSDNPRNESPPAIAEAITAGYRRVRAEGFTVELDRRQAIERLLRQARSGDVVLIAGKGHETYQEFDNTIVPFDDRSVALAALELLGHGRVASASK